ncbi:zinc-binding dehydrogenase [Kibdelosporangium phytohabitans]|uniref:Oxidoreductase n=1 Tax=Kibdelosporangium phytohabitans TaxID=860235 RepID=A0A0N9I620_9PSEU|nr:zinc-binding dehydrogenase [Kibdelosporangium phytohabitans]ALG10169.1 oxidoreductase [Kibdelosporangium phytohabitans]MBE1461175.1 NADPH2:quinone reductase [Kibdelosporangium phytohabitans]
MSSRAIRQYEFGPADVLVFEEVPAPVPDRGQVRVRVAAAGVHVLDTSIRRGESGGPMPLPRLPMTPGREVAGVVDAVGEGVGDGWVGRRVVAHLGMTSGGYAELVVVNAESVHEVPDGVGFEQAVAMIGTGRTTLAVVELAGLTAGDVVLVPAAAGGMGALLVQAGRNAGAFVVGLAGGAEKVARVRELGADVVVDYRAEGWVERVQEGLGGRELTVVFDSVGGEAGRVGFELLGLGGRMLMFGYSAGEPTRFTPGEVIGRGLSVTAAFRARIANRPGGLRGLESESLAALAKGELVPLTQSFPLADAAAAHRALETRGTVGKVVLVA